jgi:hypothetical protein
VCQSIEPTPLEQNHLYFFVFIYLCSLYLASHYLSFFNIEGRKSTRSHEHSGRPRATHNCRVPSKGSLPYERGFMYYKCPLDYLAYHVSSEPPSTLAAAHHARHRVYMVTCSCVQTHTHTHEFFVEHHGKLVLDNKASKLLGFSLQPINAFVLLGAPRISMFI